ncbi:hypothetical protein [Nocardia alni]|uniref:hypothetical protein n=1 Tax=Nocardia alni TaxID=2815723 RepID=UPI001C240F79|nr:hypothetical protein [Nocardia alni]
MSGLGNHLLRETAALSVPRRYAAIAREARRLAGSPAMDELLDEFSAGVRYERLIAIQLAFVAGSRNYLLTQLDSEDPECTGRALSALIRLDVEPDVVLARLPRLPRRTRVRMRRALGHGDRTRLADALLEPTRELFGAAEAAKILPYCSTDVVAAALPELAYAMTGWRVLGRRHIGVVFDLVVSRAPGAGRDEWRELWEWLTTNVTAAAQHDPGLLLSLAAQAVTEVPISSLRPVAGLLARHDARAMRALVLHPTGHGRDLAGHALWAALLTLPDEALREIYTACTPRDRHRFLLTVPPARRGPIARALLTRRGIAPGQVDTLILDALPRGERAAVARELLARPGGADLPDVAELLTARLPWDEAKPVLTETIRRPDADERARGYQLLATAAAGTRDPEVILDLLSMSTRLRNEQDPVRASALHAIAALPMSLLTPAALTALDTITGDALAARDRSYSTVSVVTTIASTLLIRGAQTGDTDFTDCALRITTRLGELSVSLNLYGLHQNLPRGAEQRLFDALEKRLADDAARNRWDLTLELAEGLARRARTVPGLQRLLVRACSADADYQVDRAVRLVLGECADPATRDDHLDELLRRDASVVTLPQVLAMIAYRRTDLLDAVLDSSPRGRFWSPPTVFVPMFPGGFEHWAPLFVNRYARLLDSYARQEKAARFERIGAVRRLGRLPGTFELVERFAGDDDPTVAEAALTALSNSDEPSRAIAVLARYTDGDRARVAVGSIAACAGSLPPDRLGEAVAPLLDSPKITAVKEGVRLLADLRAPDAMAIIDALWQRPGLHRDVRRTVMSASPSLLGHERAWQLLAEGAADPDVAAAVLGISPLVLAIGQRRRFAAFLRDLAASADHRVAGQALDALARWYRWSPPDTGAVLLTRLTDLSELGLWTTAMRAMLAKVAADGDPATVTAVVERLLRAEDAEPLPDRDLPARQRLTIVLKWLTPTIRTRDVARPVATAVCRPLGANPLWHEQIIELTLAAVRWTEPESAARAIAGLAPLAVGALLTGPSRYLLDRLSHDIDRTPAVTLIPLARDLAGASDPATALAAVALIGRCGSAYLWDAPWPELLSSLRSHTHPDVRRAAHNVFTLPE